MTEASASKMRPALISGAILGVASGIPGIDCGCCLWLIGGGVLASYLYLKDLTYKVSFGDSAVLGLLTGLFGLIIATFVSLPFDLLFRIGTSDIQSQLDQLRDQDVPPAVIDFIRMMAESGPLFEILIGLLFFPILAMVGSIIGHALFQKDQGSAPPPPAATVSSTPPPPTGMGGSSASGGPSAPPSGGGSGGTSPPPGGGSEAAPPSAAGGGESAAPDAGTAHTPPPAAAPSAPSPPEDAGPSDGGGKAGEDDKPGT